MLPNTVPIHINYIENYKMSVPTSDRMCCKSTEMYCNNTPPRVPVLVHGVFYDVSGLRHRTNLLNFIYMLLPSIESSISRMWKIGWLTFTQPNNRKSLLIATATAQYKSCWAWQYQTTAFNGLLLMLLWTLLY